MKRNKRNGIQDLFAHKRALRMLEAGLNCKLMTPREVIDAYFKAFGAMLCDYSASLIVELSQNIEAFTCGRCNKFYPTSDQFFGVSFCETQFICVPCAETGRDAEKKDAKYQVQA